MIQIGPPPSPNRKEYPFVGTAEFQGLKIDIENLKGSVREGVGANGKKWKTKMKAPYGELRRTLGTDGDKVDVYLGENLDAKEVYVVNQNKPQSHPRDPGMFDEQKVMLGFDSAEDAIKLYQSQFDDPTYFSGLTVMTVDEFKKKVFSKKFKGEKIAQKIASHLMPRLGTMDVDTRGVSPWDFYYDKARDQATAVPIRPEWVNKDDRAAALSGLQQMLEKGNIRTSKPLRVSNTSPKYAEETPMFEKLSVEQAYELGCQAAIEDFQKMSAGAPRYSGSPEQYNKLGPNAQTAFRPPVQVKLAPQKATAAPAPATNLSAGVGRVNPNRPAAPAAKPVVAGGAPASTPRT